MDPASLSTNWAGQQFGTSPCGSTIGPSSRPVSSDSAATPSLPLTPNGQRTEQSLFAIPEHAQALQTTPRRSPVHRSNSLQSLSETDVFSGSSTQVTPALTRGSSAGSSRPSSFFRNSITSSIYTSPSVESLAEHKLTRARLSPGPSIDPPYSPQYARPAFLDVSPSEALQEPVSPSKIGLGITTDRDELSPMPTSGRQKITRSRSSSVAERIERARSISAASNPVVDGFQTAKHRAIGLQAGVSEETTHWSLKDARNSQQVLYVLSSAHAYTRLTHLDISCVSLPS
jgi:hypothetical protein